MKLALVLLVAAAMVWGADAWIWGTRYRRRPSGRCSWPSTGTGVDFSDCWWPFSNGETCNFECEENFERVSGSTNRTCESGSWSGEALVCRRTSGCSSPPYPSGAWRRGCSWPYTEGEVCTYTCFSGFEHTSGNTTRTCSGGQWTGDPIVCERTSGCTGGWWSWWGCR